MNECIKHIFRRLVLTQRFKNIEYLCAVVEVCLIVQFYIPSEYLPQPVALAIYLSKRPELDGASLTGDT